MRKRLRFPDENYGSLEYLTLTTTDNLDKTEVISAELFSTTDSSKFLGANFISSSLDKGSIWISGLVERYNNVLWNVQVPDFKIWQVWQFQ